jgi:hypothetical protein
VPFAGRYELYTDEAWVTARFELSVEGPGFVRTVRLERASGRWRVTGTEQGDLDAALRAAGHAPAGIPGAEDPDALHDAADVDLAGSPLTNTMPIRRLKMLDDLPGSTHPITAAWVLLPGLEVVTSEQSYTVLGDGAIRFTSGTFSAELTVDPDGYVNHYPGLAERA